jgi:hypothetical protein
VNIARRGIPVACFVTSKFREQGDFVAQAAGMPDVPRVLVPHPVAGTGREAMRRLAEAVAPALVRTLSGADIRSLVT